MHIPNDISPSDSSLQVELRTEGGQVLDRGSPDDLEELSALAELLQSSGTQVNVHLDCDLGPAHKFYLKRCGDGRVWAGEEWTEREPRYFDTYGQAERHMKSVSARHPGLFIELVATELLE
jgi:hypothetical protein